MSPAQVPGTLGIACFALAAVMLQLPSVVFLLGVGCAAAWFSLTPEPKDTVRAGAHWMALSIWAACGFFLLVTLCLS